MDFKLNHGFDYPKPYSDSLKFGRSVPRGIRLRETGFKLKQNGISKEFQFAAEDKLVLKNHELMPCQLPGPATRSTFLMVFSPDGKKVASTHGNHNVYVTDLTNGKNINILTGHPRTPWCVAFHPSSNQILASGCLAGQVRVWDLSGGSEIWTVKSQTVIASIAFHPTDRMLVIATYNELYFWDWSQPEPFAKCHTSNEKEKVRYIAFDPLGHKLITGISNAPNIQTQWDRPPLAFGAGFSHMPVPTQDVGSSTATQPRPNVPQDQERRISLCYRSLVQQYDQLVRRYYDLSRSRAARTMDRGTDPMEQEPEPPSAYFPPPTTSRSANLRGFSQARCSAVPLHHTQRRSGRSRFPTSRRITFPRSFSRDSVGSQTLHRSSHLHSESSSRRFFHYTRRRQNAHNSSPSTPGTNTSGTLFGNRRNNSGGDPHNNNTTDQRVHVRTYEVGHSGPVLPSFSISRYLPGWPSTVYRTGEERPPQQQPHTDPPPPTRRDTNGSFFPYYRSAFEPRSPGGEQQPLPHLFRASVARQLNPEPDSSADVGVRYGIQLLSRHIDNMQQLCRARLEILQLQQIRRMWEHLQRQIRSLHVAVRDGSMLPTNLDPPRSAVNDASSSERAVSSESAFSTRSRGTSTIELENLSLNSDSHISVVTETPNGSTPEGRHAGSSSTARSTANMADAEPRSFQPLPLNATAMTFVTNTNVNNNCKTDNTVPSSSTSVPSSSTSSSFKEPALGQGDRTATPAARGTCDTPIPSNNSGSEGQPPSLLSYLPFRRLSGLRRRRLLSAFLRIEREMGIGRSRCNSGIWNFRPPNSSRRQRSCAQEANSTPSTQAASKGYGRKACFNNYYRFRDTFTQPPDRPSRPSQVAKDNCEVNTPSQTESQSMPSTSNGTSVSRDSSGSGSAVSATQTSPPGFSGQTSGMPGTKRAVPKFEESNTKAEELAGKRQKIACPSAHPNSRRVTFEEQETLPSKPSTSMENHSCETPRTVPTDTTTPCKISQPPTSRNASTSCPEPSTSRGAASRGTATTESMALRPMIAHLEELVRQQRAYQRSRMLGARGGVPRSQTSDSVGSRFPFSWRLNMNDNDSNSTGQQHRLSAEERLTSAIENETEHVNRLQQSPSGPQPEQNRSGEGECTRLRARQVLSLMVESLTQFFEENGLSSNRPSPGVLDEQIYNLYMLLQLALELTDLLLAQLVSTRRELEHQWTHRLRSPVAVNASTVPEQQRNASRARDLQRSREALYHHRFISESRTHNNDSLISSPVGFTHNRDVEIRNEYMLRVQRFRNSMPQTPPIGASLPENVNSNRQQQQQDIFTVPLVRVNDVLILDTASLNQQPRQRPQSPPLDFPGTVPHPQQLRYLHPRYYSYYNQPVDSSGGSRQEPTTDYLRVLQSGLPGLPGAPEHVVHDTPAMPTHRIQAWDFSNLIIPNISNGEKNIVASECKIHNDASIDISSDGHLLVTLLPSGRLSMSTMLGVYSLQWRNLGQCLYTTSFEQNAVSVSLSPINRHLLVGLACRRIAPMSTDYLPMAQIFRLDGASIPGARGRLCLLRDVEQGREHGYMSINCIRWAPWPGQGLVYGTNTGQLKILR